jgi:hypothetical protein
VDTANNSDPKDLHRDLKLHCVSAETSVMEFVTKAIEERLAAEASTPKRALVSRRSRR